MNAKNKAIIVDIDGAAAQVGEPTLRRLVKY